MSRKNDTLESIAADAAKLVSGMALSPPFEVQGGFHEADTVEGVTDNDCELPCVGDMADALNICVRLAKIHAEEAGKKS